MTEAEIEALRDGEWDPFSTGERAALRLATVLSNAVDDHTIAPEELAELQEHFTDAQIVELAMVIAVLAGMARFLFSFELADREDACPIDGHR